MSAVHRVGSLFLLSAAALAVACAGSAPRETPAASASESAPSTQPAGLVARAELGPVGGSGVTGTVTFTAVGDGVRVEAHVNGLAPGDHGFHVHMYGDCSAPDGTSAGGHFNPMGVDHGALDAQPSHVGDLGNLRAGADGHAMSMFTTRKLSLGSGESDVLGRAVIVHAKADDLTSQPTGAAGPRVACGVILASDGSTAPVLRGS